MELITVLSDVTFAAINYIVISTISANDSKATVGDLKLDLRTTKEDLMNEIKENRKEIENMAMRLEGEKE